MTMFGVADRRVTISRQTAYLVDAATAAATMTADRQPSRASLMLVQVSGGTTGSGTVTIAGTVGGVADTEAIVFTANGTKRGSKRLTALSGVTTSGFADEATIPTVSVQAVGEDGSPQPTTYSVATDYPATWSYHASQPHTAEKVGIHRDDDITVSLPRTSAWTPRLGDYITDEANNEVVEVRQVRIRRSNTFPHHWELRCSRYDG